MVSFLIQPMLEYVADKSPSLVGVLPGAESKYVILRECSTIYSQSFELDLQYRQP